MALLVEGYGFSNLIREGTEISAPFGTADHSAVSRPPKPQSCCWGGEKTGETGVTRGLAGYIQKKNVSLVFESKKSTHDDARNRDIAAVKTWTWTFRILLSTPGVFSIPNNLPEYAPKAVPFADLKNGFSCYIDKLCFPSDTYTFRSFSTPFARC